MKLFLTLFGSVDFFIHVHYEPDQHREPLLSKKTDTSIYAIPNSGAVVVEADRIETLGGVEVL